MKFEKKRFRIIIEKKALPEEEKEAGKLIRKKILKIAVPVLSLCMIGIGLLFCYKKGLIAVPGGSYVQTSRLAQSVKEKFTENELYGYTYGEPIKGLKRDEVITIPVGFDFEDADIEYWNEMFAIYQDPELKHPLSPVCEYDKETGAITAAPPNYPVGNISTIGLTVEEVRKYEHNDYMIHGHDAGSDWGNMGTLYLARYMDMETGERLDTPMVSIITLEGEVEKNPRITFSIAEDGRASLYWEPLENAKEYFVCLLEYDNELGFNGSALPIDVTDENFWILESPQYSDFTYTNENFKDFEICEDDWLDEHSAASAEELYGITEGVYKWDENKDNYLCVIAVNEDGTSMFSNMYAVSEIAANLPYRTAMNAESQNGFKSNGYETIEQVSAYGYVTMCDGYTSTKLIDYETEKAKITEERYITLDEEGNYLEGENLPVLEIPYIIEGTPFEYVAKVVDYDESQLEKDMRFLEDREDRLRKKSGDVSLSIQWGREDEEILEVPKGQKTRELENVEITANCALSEYLAAGMLGGSRIIDLQEFPEAADPEFLMDAWMEAYYQNPLILGAQGYRINQKGTAIKVIYDEDLGTTARKQKKIQDKVSKVIDRIIDEDMTDLEKELAINQYLCDTIVYDEDALANAEENNFTKVDEEFKDSFTAYGALINGKCVCAGYAAAFKLLAEEAGIDAIVVTGFLEGSLAHAWNKVKIDGEWEIVDVTNNDNEYLFNALLNLPNYAGDRVLVEDKEYMLDKSLHKYNADHEENEYYRISDKYYDYDDIAGELVEELENNGKAVLRTDYTLDDEIFYEITDRVYDAMDEDTELYGYYWLGVIYLTAD